VNCDSPKTIPKTNQHQPNKPMKKKFAFLPTLIFCASSAFAADGIWTNNDSSTWSTTTNWADGTVADGAGSLANFSTIDITVGRTVTLDTSRTIGRLLFGDLAWTNSGFDWTLASSGGSILTLDNTGGTGGNPPSITIANRSLTISAALAGTDGLTIANPRSNYDTTRGTGNSSGNGGVSQTSGTLLFTNANSLSGALSANGGTVRVGGATGSFSSATALSVTGNGQFFNGDATAANNNGITNRIGDGTATLTLGGASGAGTFTSAFAATTTSQTFASLTINAGQNVLNTVNTAAGTNDLIFTGTGGAGYVRNTNGLLNVVSATGFNPQFTNAPTAAGGSSVSGTGSDAILTGAVLNGNDFIAAASGNLSAATYDTTLTAGKNVNVTGALSTSGNLSINSLRFGENAARTLTIGASDTLTLASGGILTGSAVATLGSGNRITGGSITSGQGDLSIYANGFDLSNPRVGGNALTIDSKITGAMSVTVGGGQQVVFGNSGNDYTGGTFFTGGILAVGSDGALGAASGTVTAVGGTNYLAPTANFTFNASRNFVVNSGAVLFIGDRGATTTIAGQLSGGGQFGPGFVSNGQKLILTGANSGFTGQYLVNGRLEATEGAGLSSNANLLFTGRAGFGGGVLETSGTFTRSLGSGAGQVQWQNVGQYGSGGFAAVGGALNVNLGGNVTPDTLTWGSGYFLPASGQELVLRSGDSPHVLTFQNPIALNGGSRRVVTSGVVTMSGVLSGNASSGINKLSTGTLALTGSNTYQGATTVSAGTLSVSSLNSVTGGTASSSLGAPITKANGTIGIGSTTTAALLYTSTGETTDRVINLAGTTGGATLDQSGTGNLKFTSDFTATGAGSKNLALQGSTAGTGEIAGAIVDNSPTHQTRVTKSGTGTWTLSGSNTYTGLTTVSAGTLALSGGNDRLATTGAITIGASGTLDLDGNTQTTTGAVTFTSGATLKGGTLTSNNAAIAGNNALTGTLNLGTSGAFVTNQRLLVANGGTGSLTIGTGSTGSITFGGDNSDFMNYLGVGGGTGTLTVNGGTVNFNNSTVGTGNGYLNVGSNSNTSTGSIVVNGGNMNVGTWLKLGGNFNNGAGTNATSSLAISTGTVTVGGGSVAGNGVLYMNGGAGDNTANTGNATLTLNSGGVLNVKQIQVGNGGTKTISFDGGTLRAGASSTTFLNAATGLTVNVKDGGATIDTQASDITVAAALVANGTGGLTKSGGGTLTLSGVNTYTGATLISGGTLKLDATGTVNNTSEVSLGTVGTFDVSDKGPGGYTVGTLKGSGNVTGALTVSTTLAIGNSPGTTNFSSDLTLGATSTYLYELIGGATLGLNSADLGDIVGTLTITAGSILDLVQLGTYTAGNKFTLFAYDGLLTGTFKDTSSNDLADGATFTDAGGIWMIDYNDTSPGANGGVSASNTYVTITAVPEPSTMTLAGLLLTVGLLRRRRN
jgi:autotransporter-associated beta strand protein